MAATNISIEEAGVDTKHDIPIKEEFSLHIEENLELKTETDDATENITESPFEEELQIKDEFTISIERDDSQSSAEVAGIKDEAETESILPTSSDNIEVKFETGQDDSIASYDYPSYDGSMDSNDLAALNHVEACLSDDINVKPENDVYEENQKDFPRVIKDESELTVTETHLISNKVINTTSTITNTHDGIIESQTTKTLIMEIHPMTLENQTLKMGNPEEILPTTNETYEHMNCEPFQLNSITGNILSLEQEAYGLLKRKKTSDIQDLVCPKCPKIFTSERAFNRHLKVHETRIVSLKVCPKCPKVCTTTRSLNIHLKVHASIESREMGLLKSLQTRMENKIKIKKELKEAEDDKDVPILPVKNTEKEGYKCTCGKVFQRRSRMETCLRSHTDFAGSSSYDCSTCDKKFNSKDLLTFHRQRHHRKKFPCKFCPTDYHTQKELFKHLRIHQKVQLMEYKVITEVAKGDQELQCLLCDKTCSNLSDLQSHIMEGHKEPYRCPHCAQAFTKIVDFANHVKKTHPDVCRESVLDVLGAFSKLVKAWKCENCGKQFHKADKLALHQVEEHTPDMKNEQHFQCGDCQRVFVSKCGLNSHMRMHHRTESTEEPEPEEVGVLCLECRKVCKDMQALTSHMRLHSMDRKYPCKYCDFRFSTPQKRKAHAEIHTGDMKYVCFICEYTCSSENRLKQHKMSVKHISMKEYLLTGKPLPEEGQSTSKKQKIKDTLRKKEWGVKKKKKSRKEEESDIACDICGEMFPGEAEMQEHKQTHPFIEFPNDDKPSRIFFK